MTTYLPSLCLSCKRFRPDSATCEAFPSGIPDSILVFGADHREHVGGDHGITHLLDPAKAEHYEDWLQVFGD